MPDPPRQEESPHDAVALPDNLTYLAVEGVAGVGKTALAQRLAHRFRAQLVMDDVYDNPFLERFFTDRPKWAFQTQVAFLAGRYRQQQSMIVRDLFYHVTIADYAFDKDRIYAHLNLHGDEARLYETLYTIMEPNTPRPDLVVYLQSSPERTLKAFEERCRRHEPNLDPEYVASLHEAYTYYFFRYAKSPLLVIDADKMDFVRQPEDLDELIRLIAGTEHYGTTYFRGVSSAAQEP